MQESRQENRLIEIAVRMKERENPEAVAREWARRLDLADGVHISVVPPGDSRRQRRFVAYEGEVITTQQYAALLLCDPIEKLLYAAARPMDAWEIFAASRRQSSPLSATTVATITRAARLLQEQGRLRRGPSRGTWVAARAEAVA